MARRGQSGSNTNNQQEEYQEIMRCRVSEESIPHKGTLSEPIVNQAIPLTTTLSVLASSQGTEMDVRSPHSNPS
jgi:hypothetical protein